MQVVVYPLVRKSSMGRVVADKSPHAKTNISDEMSWKRWKNVSCELNILVTS